MTGTPAPLLVTGHPAGRPETARIVPPVGPQDRRTAEAVLRRIIAGDGPRMVFQPQLSLSRLTVTGYEALSRFPQADVRGTESWFTLAAELGLGPELELAAVRRALLATGRPRGTSLALNLSPALLTGDRTVGRLLDEALPCDLTGIEIELTEQADLQGSTGRLRDALDALRARGATVAIDDIGIAHSGLRRVVELAPDRLKIDRHLVQGVSQIAGKAALVRTIVQLAGRVGATVCAEGVETVEDLDALAELEVDLAQGWLIGPPARGFATARTVALRAARNALQTMLGGTHLPATAAPTTLDELTRQLAEVTDAADLGRLVAISAGLVPADGLRLSGLTCDGTLHPLLPGPPPSEPDQARLTWPQDAVVTRRCLTERLVVPIYRPEGAALLVPVVSRGRTVGLLECARGTATVWSRREVGRARRLAGLVGPALDLLTTPQIAGVTSASLVTVATA